MTENARVAYLELQIKLALGHLKRGQQPEAYKVLCQAIGGSPLSDRYGSPKKVEGAA